MVISPTKEIDLVQFQRMYLFISYQFRSSHTTLQTHLTLPCSSMSVFPPSICSARPRPVGALPTSHLLFFPLHSQDTLCITQCPKYFLVISSLDGTWLTACSCTFLALRIKYLPQPESPGSGLYPYLSSDWEEGNHNLLWNLVLKLEALIRGYDLK